MTNTLVCLDIEKSIIIKATPEKVWHVLTDKESTKCWAASFRPGTSATSDWQVGGKVVWSTEGAPAESDMTGEITMLLPNQLLVVDFGHSVPTDDQPGCTYAETYSIVPKEDGVVLSIKAGGMGEKDFAKMAPAWEEALNCIKDASEK